jgi:HEPN domain-containing protein
MAIARTKKSDFQALAERRMREARVLLAANEADGAYYLGGYAVECGLKACIIKMLNSSDEWQDRNFSELCYRHDLDGLLRLAGVEDALRALSGVDAKWAIVRSWKETSRYEQGKTVAGVAAFLDAIDGPADGVLTWIKSIW